MRRVCTATLAWSLAIIHTSRFTALQRRAVSKPPRWAVRRSHGRSKHHSRSGTPHLCDSLGMFVTEEKLRAEHISFSKYDKQLEAASRAILGLEDDESPTIPATASHNSGLQLGSGLSASNITFRGRAADVHTFVRMTADTDGARPDVTAAPLKFESSETLRQRGKHTHGAGAGGAAYLRAPLSQQEQQKASTDGSGSYGGGKKGKNRDKNVSAAGKEEEAKMQVELDGGDIIKVPRRYAMMKRALREHEERSGSSGGSFAASLLSLNAPDNGGQQQQGEQEGERVRSVGGRRFARAERKRLRRDETVSLRMGPAQHPCSLQGGCRGGKAKGAPSEQSHHSCPYQSLPSVCCLEQMRHGYCAAQALGCCPWHHGDPATTRPAIMDIEVGLTMTSSSIAASIPGISELSQEGEEEAVVRARLCASAGAVERLLQLFIDLVTSALEEGGEALRTRVRHVVYEKNGGDGGTSAAREVGRVLQALCEAQGPERWLRCLCVESLAGMSTEKCNSSGADDVVWVLAVDTAVATTAVMRPELPQGAEEATGASEGHCGEVDNDAEENAVVGDEGSDVRENGSNNLLSLLQRRQHQQKAKESEDSVENAARELEAMWCEAEAEAESVGGMPHDTDSHTRAGNKELMHIMTTLRNVWGSYVVVPPASTQESSPVTVSPLLTSWVIQKALDQLEVGTDAAIPSTEAVFSSHQSTSMPPLALLISASRALLQRRRADCEAFLEAPNASSVPTWAPLLLLKDCLLLGRLQVQVPGHHEAADPFTGEERLGVSMLDSFDEDPTGSAAAAAPAAPPSLLSYVLHLDSSLGEEAVIGGASAGSPAAAMHAAAFTAAWDTVHAVLLQACAGLFHEPASDAAGSAKLVSYAQPGLLALASLFSQTLGVKYQAQLLSSVGWRPWTDTHMFDSPQSALCTSSAYVRHHMPCVELAVGNSLLNSMLVVSLHHAHTRFGLDMCSPTEALLSVTSTEAPSVLPREKKRVGGGVAREWLALQTRRSHRQLSSQLQPFMRVSLGFLSALQDHSGRVASVHATLAQEYTARRVNYETEKAKAEQGTRTRKYYGGSVSEDKSSSRGCDSSLSSARNSAAMARQQRRLEELRATSLLDRLLPAASCRVGPEATAMLLRQLLESGGAYKAMRLAVSVVHASRMLRHASKQPLPEMVPGFRTVHRRVWSEKRQKMQLVAQKVPVLRLVGAAAEEGEEESSSNGGIAGAPSSGAVRPIGLTYELNSEVAVEMVRVGLRMGEAGTKLADGVLGDCFRGGLVDFTDGRCLPLESYRSVMNITERQLKQQQQPHAFLHMRHLSVTGEGSGGSGELSSGAVAQYVIRLIMGDGREGGGRGAVAYPHYRVPPTPLLLEVLLSHTPSSDMLRHRQYWQLLLKDPARLATMSVLLALQLAVGQQRALWSARGMQCVWVTAILGSPSPAPSPFFSSPNTTGSAATQHGRNMAAAAAALVYRGEKAEAQACVDAVRDILAASPHLSESTTMEVAGTGSAGGVKTMEEVKALLGSVGAARPPHEDAKRDTAQESDKVASQRSPRPGLMSYEATLHECCRRSGVLSLSPLLSSSFPFASPYTGRTGGHAGLWAVCAATLASLTPASISGTSEANHWASSSLVHAYTTALMASASSRAGGVSEVLIADTVKLLLLSPLLQQDAPALQAAAAIGDSFRDSSSVFSRTECGHDRTERSPSLLFTGQTAVVRGVSSFLALQVALWLHVSKTTYATGEEADRSECDGSDGGRNFTTALSLSRIAEMAGVDLDAMASTVEVLMDVFFLQTLEGVRRPSGDTEIALQRHQLLQSVQGTATWSLYRPIGDHPAVALCWLRDTLCFPSPNLVLWIAGRMERSDVEGIRRLKAWARAVLGSEKDSEAEQVLQAVLSIPEPVRKTFA